MKSYIKKIAAVVSAVSIIGTMSISVSAATADDVVAAARSAGSLRICQMLQNYLKVNKFSESQYDILVDKISNVGSEMDDVALKNFGKTIAEMKGEAKVDPDTGVVDDSFLKDVVDKMTNENIMNSLNEIVEAGKKMGLNITVEQKGDKNFLMTVRDADGNVQTVVPVGKLVDTTGAEDNSAEGYPEFALLCSAVIAAGGIGAWLLSIANKKMENING